VTGPTSRPLLMDRTQVPDEPLYVLADPEDHPFCLLVG
jgi:hypothetical protein